MLTKLLNFVALVCFAIAIAFIFTVHLAQKKPSNNPSNYLKIKAMVPDFQATIPFSSGVKRIVDWYEADYSIQVIDTKLDHIMDLIIDRFETSILDFSNQRSIII